MQDLDADKKVIPLRVQPHDESSTHNLAKIHATLLSPEKNKPHTASALRTFSVHAFLQGMACMAEYYEPNIAQHLCRVHAFIKLLMKQLEGHPSFVRLLSKENQILIADAALLHDIGKVNIPVELRAKPGVFSSLEFEIITQHTIWGKEIIEENRLNLPLSTELAIFARDIAYSHHERWDGSGYPQQLKARQIPIVGRLMAIVDVYDGLISPRTYKSSLSHHDAMDILKADNDTLFDPEILEAFIAIERHINTIAMKYPILLND